MLHPLYVAIREYLEIDPRIKVLNERCRVFLDLADILADSVADAKMSYITWIIIILIVISIIVTVTEVILRFGMLSSEKNKIGHVGGPGNVIGGGDGDGEGAVEIDLRMRRSFGLNENLTAEDLRLWSQALSEREKEVVCGGDYVGRTFAGI